MNFHNVYGKIARDFYILDTPGPTPATVKNVDFGRLERPYFPKDAKIDGDVVRVLA